MNKRTADITAAVRDLDPAAVTDLTDAERERADATFARILATPSPEHVPQESVRPRRRWVRLLAPVVLVGAAVPALLLSGGPAFASWTPKPEPLNTVAAAKAITTCRGNLSMPDQGETVAIAERRGEWTYVLLSGPTAEASCLMSDDLIRQGGRTGHEQGFMGSYDPDPPQAPTVARDRIDETEMMGGSVPVPGRWPFTTSDGYVEWVEGYVGSDVAGVTVHPPVGPDVEASVRNGRFTAWWPRGVIKGDNPGAGGAWSYTVTLADGTTRPAAG